MTRKHAAHLLHYCLDDKKGLLGFADVWVRKTICADTKLICSWTVGRRNGEAARTFAMHAQFCRKNRTQAIENQSLIAGNLRYRPRLFYTCKLSEDCNA
jgi:hypothetical protein